MEKLHLSCLVPIFYEKNILIFFISNQVKNSVKVQQLAKQPPTFMQKILIGL